MELLATWPGSRHRNGVIWNIIPHCLMWGIWWERNSQIFEGTKRLIRDFKLSFFQTLLGWMNASGVFNFTSLSNFLDSCTFYASDYECQRITQTQWMHWSFYSISFAFKSRPPQKKKKKTSRFQPMTKEYAALVGDTTVA